MMLTHAATCFAITLLASLCGFGGFVETFNAAVKALAVIFLVLFFVSLFRLLYDSEPPRSADS